MARKATDPKRPEPMALQLSASKALWRDSEALFCVTAKDQQRAPRNVTQASLSGAMDEATPILAIGVATDQAKFLLWRRELWTIPTVLLTQNSGFDLVSAFIQEGERSHFQLKQILRKIAQNLLSGRPEKADKDRVSALVRSWNADRAYWSILGSAFWSYVGRAEYEGHIELVEEWKRLVYRSRKEVLRMVAKSLGPSHRNWRAIAIAEGEVKRRLA